MRSIQYKIKLKCNNSKNLIKILMFKVGQEETTVKKKITTKDLMGSKLVANNNDQ